VVNLYPFVQTISQAQFTFEEAIENIDIGGPTMLRSAAKNHKHVGAIVDPRDYGKIMEEMDNNDSCICAETRFEFARKVFNYTAAYDAAIAGYLNDLQGVYQPDNLTLTYHKVGDLRYGENPHQQASLYQDIIPPSGSLVQAKQLQGKELSFNNYLDFDSAQNIVHEFDEPCVVIIKHNNPAGVAIDKQGDTPLYQLFDHAWGCDPVSAFGSVIAINREVDEKLGARISDKFIEGVIAPGFADKALALLQGKKNLRLLQNSQERNSHKRYDTKRISGGLLLQEEDDKLYHEENLRVVTQKEPSAEEWEALQFQWRVSKFVKSNAIVIGGIDRFFGIGAGQMSRVDSVKIAIDKARDFHHELQGAVMASDAFFPFRDGIDEAAKHGISAVIQPGGSVKDQEVIAACDEHGISMVVTGMRHFRH
jgi:phosphoribosylaminoimidazolecarboxamide formyltransferase/IMP cyclohydrolase